MLRWRQWINWLEPQIDLRMIPVARSGDARLFVLWFDEIFGEKMEMKINRSAFVFIFGLANLRPALCLKFFADKIMN